MRRRVIPIAIALSMCADAIAQAPRDGLFGHDGAPLANATPVLYSQANTNDLYQLWVRWPLARPCGPMRLVLDGTAIAAGSWGNDATVCTASIELDVAQATRAAAVLRIARQDRHPIGEQVRARFRASATEIRAGESMRISITISNPAGAPRVSRLEGGRNRGPRDDQWNFRIERDGQRIPRSGAQNFGGTSVYVAMEPGTSGRLHAPLARWGDISQPGSYVVRCSYETTLAPDGVDPYEDAHRGEVWDRRFEGVVRFTVLGPGK